tara:strand:+ start:1233 stop:1547 length:315 start_codon:yes stop_codon:yes gene_type:complete
MTLAEIVENNIHQIFSLQDRWEDEKEYEDFADYVKAIRLILQPHGYVGVRLTKKFTITALNSDANKVKIQIGKGGKVTIDEWKPTVDRTRTIKTPAEKRSGVEL